jgi:hypothetical protein
MILRLLTTHALPNNYRDGQQHFSPRNTSNRGLFDLQCIDIKIRMFHGGLTAPAVN